MLPLRYLYVLALVVWLGGMLVAGLLVAPTVFGVLEAHDPEAGRAAAGLVFGTFLRRFHFLSYAAGGVMVVSLTLLRLLGPRPVSYGIRAGLIAVMLGLFGYSGFLVAPRVEALQREIGGPVSRLPANDARRTEFDGLHRLSTVLLGVAAVSGLILLRWEARE
jgi:uncharacterized membrane protein